MTRRGWPRLAGVACLYDHAVAIERAGQAADGSYYTMRALSMDHLVAPIDALLTTGCACGGGAGGAVVQAGSTASPVRAVPAVRGGSGDSVGGGSWPVLGAPTSPGLRAGSGSGSGTVSPTSPLRLVVPITRTSTGIGDGGNEAGMGCMLEAVRAHIPRGDTIACVTPADHLITAGVSNWGGWGLVAAVEATLRQRAVDAGVAALPPVWAELVARPPGALLPSETQERALAEAMVAAGARDGITGALDGSVDGMPLDTHIAVLAELRSVLADVFGEGGGAVR